MKTKISIEERIEQLRELTTAKTLPMNDHCEECSVSNYRSGYLDGQIEVAKKVLPILEKQKVSLDKARSDLRIVCAANRCNKDEHKFLLVGARHWDDVMREQFSFITKHLDISHYDFVQGFIDNRGNFHTREEAFLIATAANQIIKKTGGDKSVQLFSEDLY